MNDWKLPNIDQQKCTKCGSCAKACPQGVLEMVDGELVFVQPLACTYCTECERICPEGAISCGFTVGWSPNA